MNPEPLVSIITPSYNSANFIEETILSVANQTYPQIEHIIMDGGSTDGTLEIIKKYRDRITWVSEPDKGQSDAINKGWKKAKGDILGWLNADDTYTPSAVETAVKTFAENPDISMVYGDCTWINEQSKVIVRRQTGDFDLEKLLCRGSYIPQPTVFLRKIVPEKIGYLDTDLHMAMDIDYWIRIGIKLKVKYIPEMLAFFRLSPGAKTARDDLIFGLDRLHIHSRVFSDSDLPEEIRNLEKRSLSCAHLSACAGYLKRHQFRNAMKHLNKSISIYPLEFIKPIQIGYLITSAFGIKTSNTISKWKAKVFK